MISKMKRKPTEYLLNHISEELMSQILKELLQLNIRNAKNPNKKNGQMA